MKLVKPKKFLGQHFLKDLKVAQDIADTVDTFPELPILEVGPHGRIDPVFGEKRPVDKGRRS